MTGWQEESVFPSLFCLKRLSSTYSLASDRRFTWSKMSKKGAKGKGGKAKSKGGHNQQTGSTAPQAPPQAVEELETQQLPKFPPYEKLRYAPTCPLDTIEPIQKLLGTPLRITLSDGRFIIGELSSLDNYRNLILSNTYQAHINTVPGGTSLFFFLSNLNVPFPPFYPI